MTTTELLDMYPAGLFQEKAAVSWEDALYKGTLVEKLAMTADEASLLQQHGFVVSERLRMNSFIEQFLDIWKKDLPVFISSDAILHAFHYYYVKILQQIETGMLVGGVTEMLQVMHGQLPELESRYGIIPIKYGGSRRMEQMLKDVDVYLTVPRKLLGEDVDPYFQDNAKVVNELLDLIRGEQLSAYPLFSENCRDIDFSQFKPRGHYTEDPVLTRYFQAMMWLGRTELYLLKPSGFPLSCSPQTIEDIQRQTIDAILLLELMELADVDYLYQEIESVLALLIGEQDNATPPQLQLLIRELDITRASQLLNADILVVFQHILKKRALGFQRITSQVIAHDPFSPESVEPATAFLLFGQRFILDAYIAGNVVYDRIKFMDEFICRLYPSTLDILFALGNDAAAQLLVPELDDYRYASNLAALRYLVDSYDDTFWQSSVYTMWLDAIRALNPPGDRDGLPSFMKTGAWWQQKMNTQLASWTELRHDHLLYAKPPYTSSLGCSYPCGYVEPIPGVFDRLNQLAASAKAHFSAVSFADPVLQSEILDYFSLVDTISGNLAAIARKELNNTPLSTAEQTFLKEVLFRQRDPYIGDLDGWYMKLLYGPRYIPMPLSLYDPERPVSDYLTADYHTIPTDCSGSVIGNVSHAATGPVDLAIIVARTADADGQAVAFAGPVMTYYEYRTTNFERLTDEEWEHYYFSQTDRPGWSNLFLSDPEGKRKPGGANLITSVFPLSQPAPALFVAESFPNPFRSSTVIRLTIPSINGRAFAGIRIIDVQGRTVRTLLEDRLPAGAYLTRWDGANQAGQQVPPGIYFYEVICNKQRYVGKMVKIE